MFKHNFKVGELVEIDRKFSGGPYYVTVKRIGPCNVFATVENDQGGVWDTVISRLSKIENEKTVKESKERSEP
jgi:hypothetical protein